MTILRSTVTEAAGNAQRRASRSLNGSITTNRREDPSKSVRIAHLMTSVAATALVATLLAWPFRATLLFDVPEGWVAKRITSSMRVADFTLPKIDGDTEDATLTMFFFRGAGGTVQANLDRWIGQMAQPDGRASKGVARTTSLKSRSGLAITQIDVTGTYVAEVTPGSAERHHKPGYRLRAAVIESRDGPYFMKLTGPERTVGRWDDSVNAFLNSLRTR
jgi:hypothetical protein